MSIRDLQKLSQGVLSNIGNAHRNSEGQRPMEAWAERIISGMVQRKEIGDDLTEGRENSPHLKFNFISFSL